MADVSQGKRTMSFASASPVMLQFRSLIMINVGIIGLGFMAAAHLKAYRQVPGACIAALCNPSGRHLDGDFSQVAGNVGTADPLKLDMTGVKATRDFNELLNDPAIHAIDICSPTAAHAEQAIAALRAGKHVLCEKPLARTAAEAQRIVEAARSAKAYLMPAMCLRFWPEWAWVKEAIAQATYGKVMAARFRRVAEAPGWGQSHFGDGKKSGGALLDLHIHDTDFVQFCFGRPKAVFSTGGTKFSGAIDHVVTQYVYESGVSIHAEGSWAMTPGFGFNMAYTVVFEGATVDYDLARGADALKLFESGRPARVLKLDQPDGYVGELRHFAECIAAGCPPSTVTPADGASAVEICECEEKSILTRQIVQLDQSI